MKTLIKTTLLFSLFSLLLSSCNDDDYSTDKFVIRYGVIEGTSGDYAIRCDDGSRLLISANLVPQISVKDGDRFIVDYTPLQRVEADKPKVQSSDYYVRLNMLYYVLSKAPVAESFILKDQQKRNDSIGNDPIRILDASFGGNYLNIAFEVERHPGSSIKHFINLVNDDTYTKTDSVQVTLRHNGYEDIPTAGMATYTAFSRVSFKISSLIPEGKESINMGLHWTEYGRTIDERIKMFDSGTFTPYGSNSAAKTTGGLKTKSSNARFDLDKIATTVE